MHRILFILLLALAVSFPGLEARGVAAARPSHNQVAATLSPADLFGELFVQVQTSRLFTDSKTFVDAVPRRTPAAIMAAFRQERPVGPEALRVFVLREFLLPTPPAAPVTTKSP